MPVNGSTLIPWIVDQTGNDSNGGTSTAIRSSGTDGVTNGTTTFTAASGAFTSADTGHGIQIGANWRLIASVTNGTTLVLNATVATASGQTWTLGGPLRTINKVANLAGAPLAAGDVIAVAPNPLPYRENITLAQSGAAVGGAITGVSAAAPAVITTTSPHGQVVGQYVYISGVVGASEVNGPHRVTAVGSTTTYTIDNAAAPSSYTSGGTTQQQIAVIGDVDGAYTGKVGDVIVSPFNNGDEVAPTTNFTLSFAGKAAWAWRTLLLYGSSGTLITSSVTTAQYMAFFDCAFVAYPLAEGSSPINLANAVDTPYHWWFERCTFRQWNLKECVFVVAPTSTVADYDIDLQFNNCLFEGTYCNGVYVTLIALTNSGANAFQPGGCRLRNCTLINGSAYVTTGTKWSAAIPAEVVNCRLIGNGTSTALNSNDTTLFGAIVEDYNLLLGGTLRSNVKAGTATVAVAAPMLEGDYGSMVGRGVRARHSPAVGDPALGFGQTEIAIGRPGTVADDATVGSSAWATPANASAEDAVFTTNVATTGTDTHYLKFTNFSWSQDIPAGATIDGIRVEVFVKNSLTTGLTLNAGSAGAKLVKGGVIGGGRKTDATVISTAVLQEAYGSHGDLWGNTLSVADVQGSTFGFAIAFHNANASSATVSVDFGRILVYYHLPTPKQAVDRLNRPRPAGQALYLDAGTASAGGAATLTDSTKAWGANQWATCELAITGGTGSGQRKVVKSNTGTVITCYSNWQTNPDGTSTYTIFNASGGDAETGVATAGAATSLTVSNASWPVNAWSGATLELTGGTGAGQRVPVLSNTATVLTIGPQTNSQWVTNPDNTSVFALYRGIGGVSSVQNAAGCYERHDTAERETAIVDAGQSTALRLTCPADQDRPLNVLAGARVYTVKYRSEAGVTPTVTVKANAEVGLTADVVATGAAGQGTYTTLTLNFTPTAIGTVTVRFGCTGTLANRCYFSTEALT